MPTKDRNGKAAGGMTFGLYGSISVQDRGHRPPRNRDAEKERFSHDRRFLVGLSSYFWWPRVRMT